MNLSASAKKHNTEIWQKLTAPLALVIMCVSFSLASPFFLRIDNIIAKQYRERFIPNKLFRAQYRMSQSLRLFLPNIMNRHVGNLAYQFQQLGLSLFFQR